MIKRLFPLLFLVSLIPYSAHGQVSIDTIGMGWAATSVNTVVFRKNSLVTSGESQYAAYYDSAGYVVLAKRNVNERKFTVQRTSYHGNVADAHNSISIAADGDGYLHVTWDHHNSKLRYSRSLAPGSLALTSELPMTGNNEDRITYPEFYKLPSGDLLFFYRSGESGEGNLIINRYDVRTKKWRQLQQNLIDGEGERNAYWQACVDSEGTIHLSWVWRETWDVSSNHDLCYARSTDGGITWMKSSGEKYMLPITAKNAEYALKIPQGSELINQTSMCADNSSRPYIATYWRETGKVPQYFLVYLDGKKWKKEQVSHRTMDFSLRGTGTKKIPISRPQVLVNDKKLILIYRDAENDNKVSVATRRLNSAWTVTSASDFSVGDWEPTYDHERWRSSGIISLFIQRVGQGDGEKREDVAPQYTMVLSFNSNLK